MSLCGSIVSRGGEVTGVALMPSKGLQHIYEGPVETSVLKG